jgi:hypothetical protein
MTQRVQILIVDDQRRARQSVRALLSTFCFDDDRIGHELRTLSKGPSRKLLHAPLPARGTTYSCLAPRSSRQASGTPGNPHAFHPFCDGLHNIQGERAKLPRLHQCLHLLHITKAW